MFTQHSRTQPLFCYLLLGAAGIAYGQAPAAGYTYNIVAKLSGKTLDVTGGFSAASTFLDTTPIQQYTILGPTQTNQRFRLISEDGGTYTIRSKSSGKCLDVTGGLAAKQNGIKIQQYACNGQANQRWTLVPLAGADAGYFEIVSVNSALVLDVVGGLNATANQDLLQQWQWGNTDNQKFKFDNKGKTVVCIDGLNESALHEGEGWERVGIGPVDVVQRGGQFPACLAQVASGDDLVIVAHGVPVTNAGMIVGGASGFIWGANTFTGFGNGAGQGNNPAPLPQGFNGLTNVTVTLKICYGGTAPVAGTGSLVAKMLTALGNGAGDQVVGYAFTSDTLTSVGITNPPPLTAAAVRAAFIAAGDGWTNNPPVNRPGAAVTQQTVLQGIITAAVGPGAVVTISNARTLGRPGDPTGYANTFWNVRLPVPPGNIPAPQVTLDITAPACPAANSNDAQPCGCGGGTPMMTAMPQDVTGQISVLLNSVGTTVQLVHITNTGSSLSGPIYLVFDQLPSSMLTNATGVTALDGLRGSPYIEVDTSLATGGGLLVRLMITDPDKYGIGYSIRVLSGGAGVL